MLFLALFLSASPLAPPSADGTLLATIPEDLEVTTELVPTSSLGTYVRRSSLVWSADGTAVAYAATRGASWVPVVGAEVGERHDYVSRPVIAGGRVVFRVSDIVDESTQRVAILVDGTLLEAEDWIGEFAVAPDGKRIAYWTQPGSRYGDVEASKSWDQFLTVATEKREGAWTVSRPKDEYRGEAIVPPLFTRDGRKVFSFALRSNGGWVVVERAGQRVKELTDKSGQITTLAVAASGKTFAHAVQESPGTPPEVHFGKKVVGRAHADLPLLAVDAAGARVAYATAGEGGVTVAVGVEQDLPHAFDHVLELAFDPEGTHVAFVANVDGLTSGDTPGQVEGGRSFVVVRPAKGAGEWREEPRFEAVRDLVWNQRGARLAYAARVEDGWIVVCGEARSEPADEVGPPVFLDGGSTLGFGERRGRELWWRTLVLE